MTHHDLPVLVVGLGPAGAVMAVLLAQHGVPHVVVMEETDGSTQHKHPRAVAVDDEVVRTCIQRIGLLERFRDTTSVAAHMQLVTDWITRPDEEVKVLSGIQVPPGRPGAWTKAHDDDNKAAMKVGRNGLRAGGTSFWAPQLERDFRQLLLSYGDVIDIQTCRKVVNVMESDDDYVTVEAHQTQGHWERDAGLEWRFIFEESNTNPPKKHVGRYSFVIGCDGARSAIRRLRFPNTFQSLAYAERWLVVDILVDINAVGTLVPYFTTLTAGKRPYIFVGGTSQSPDLPAGKKHIRIDVKLMSGGGEDHLPARHFLEPIGLVEGSNYELIRYAVYDSHALIAERWSTNRVFLVGDAAHIMPPFLGQGLTSGFRDAVSLSWRIAAANNGMCGKEVLIGYQDRISSANFIVAKSVEVGVACGGATETPIDRNLISNAFLKSGTYSDRLARMRPNDVFAGTLFPQWCMRRGMMTSDKSRELSDSLFHQVHTLCYIVWLAMDHHHDTSRLFTSVQARDVFTTQCHGKFIALDLETHFAHETNKIPKCLRDKRACLVLPDMVILGTATTMDDLVMTDLRREIGTLVSSRL